LKETNLHFIGDSNVSVFGGLSKRWIAPLWPQRVQSLYRPNWWCYHVGPHLAVNFGKHGTPVVREVVKTYFNSVKDFLCLVWGEIDCRMWIVKRAYKRAQRNGLQQEIEIEARLCGATYLRDIDTIVTDIPLTYQHILVIGPHPSPPWPIGNRYPSFGTEPERNLATRILNDELKKGMSVRGGRFITLFDRLMPIGGYTDYYQDVVHLSSLKALPLFIEEFKVVGVT